MSENNQAVVNVGRTYIYYELKMKTPTPEFKVMGFKPLAEDINFAVSAFNKKYLKRRQIIIVEVEDFQIRLLLVDEEFMKKTYSIRDIVFFSKYLFNDRNWQRFSRDNNTLFYAGRNEEFTAEDAYTTLIEENLFPYDYLDFEELDIPSEEDNNEEDLNILSEEPELTDEQALDAFRLLLSTRNLGHEKIRESKEEDIISIKATLTRWIVK
ncbi:MAG: hypothetical protein KO464_05510 [Candidatus Methanofastidiosum sp.]|nr:hypothetical protein [Methanofastidiosum sp.]